MKRIFSAAVLILLAVVLFTGCASKNVDGAEISALSFSDSITYSNIEALDQKRVSIIGYMATLSPLNGKYMYLMNLPYQNCPFCVPNTTQLANTMAVFAKDGQKFDYTEQAIRVTGRMELDDFSDDYGYTYNYRIADATYEVIDLSAVSGEYALWQSIAEDGVVTEIYAMFDYLNFVCQWTEYQETTEDNDTVDVYYLWPGDAENILNDDGAYGYASYRADDYFPKLVARVEAISKTGLTDLADILGEAKALEQYAFGELSGGHYTYDEYEDKYTLNNADELERRFYEVYDKFTAWFARWEL